MKKLNVIYGALFFVLMTSMCSCNSKQSKAFTVNMQVNNLASSSFECDSVNMKSLNHAEYYVNGHKMNVYAKSITIESNN